MEGDTESIFVEHFLYFFLGSNVQLKKKEIYGTRTILKLEDVISKEERYYALIVNARNDEKVASVIQQNYKSMMAAGYDKIIGLRDLFPIDRKNKKRSIETIRKIFSTLDKVSIIFAIMEIEAWFLADHDMFTKIDSKLTPKYIQNELGYDLIHNDPEFEYKNPAFVIDKIYSLVGKKYKKGIASHGIVKNIDFEFLCLDLPDKKIPSFFLFVKEIESVTNSGL